LDAEYTLSDIMTKVRTAEENFYRAKGWVIRYIFVDLKKGQGLSFTEQFSLAILDAFKRKPSYGITHVALQVGPWMIHWHDGNLVTTHRVKSNACAMMYIQQGKSLSMANLKELAAISCDFNKGTEYHWSTNSCQTFVEKVKDHFQLKHSFTSQSCQGILYNHVITNKCMASSVYCFCSNEPFPELKTTMQFRALVDCIEEEKATDKWQPSQFEDLEAALKAVYRAHCAKIAKDTANNKTEWKAINHLIAQGQVQQKAQQQFKYQCLMPYPEVAIDFFTAFAD